MFTYPESIIDDPRGTLGLLGSAWTHYYGDNAIIIAIVQANIEILRQQRQNLEEIAACASCRTVPRYHTERLVPMELRLCDPTERTVFEGTAALRQLPILVNRVTHPTVMLQHGAHYLVNHKKQIIFERNPFENPDIPKIGDKIYMWGMNVQYDCNYCYNSWGFLLDLPKPIAMTEEQYATTTEIVFDCIRNGTTISRVSRLAGVFLGIPTADGVETVTGVVEDAYGQFVATTHNIYPMPPGSSLSVPVGVKIEVGTPLTTGLRVKSYVEVESGWSHGFLELDISPSADDAGLAALLARVVPPQVTINIVSTGDA